MPEGFLCTDAILRLAQNVTAGLQVNEEITEKELKEYLPFLATENLMMEAVRRGGNRQELHEVIRKCSMEAVRRMKEGKPCDLAERLAASKAFDMTEEEFSNLWKSENYVGRCAEQVSSFLEKYRAVYGSFAVTGREIDV